MPVRFGIVTLLAVACTDPATTDAPSRHPHARDTGGDDTAATTTDTDTHDTGTTTEPDTDTAVPDAIPAPCQTWGTPVQSGALGDASLDEVSGIAPSQQNPGVLWMEEDHGGAAELYGVDSAGNLLGTLTIDGVENSDWEDLALTRCDEGSCLWIGDIGNNDFDKTTQVILRVVEPVLDAALDPGAPFEATVTPDVYRVQYPDEPQDAEALVVTPEGLPVVFTKRSDGTSRVYLVPRLDPDDTTTMVLLETITVAEGDDVAGLRTTSADLWPDGSRFLLRTYGQAWEFLDPGAGVFAASDSGRREIPFGDAPATEAIAYDPANMGYWQVSEGEGAPIFWTGCADPP